jgi:outer membrane protein TolC
MEIPVLNQNQGPIAEAAGKRREAGTRVFALQARIAGDVDRALAAWRGAQVHFATLDDVLAAQRSRVSSLKAQFDAGAVESLDVLTAESELVTDELLQWEAQLQLQRAFGELEDAVQRPLTLDVSTNPRLTQP